MLKFSATSSYKKIIEPMGMKTFTMLRWKLLGQFNILGKIK